MGINDQGFDETESFLHL